VYCAVAFDLSATTRTSMPYLLAATSAFAIGAEAKEYAATRMVWCAPSMVLTTNSVAPRSGEKPTSVCGDEKHGGGRRSERQERL
jgi:hypothetical protein